MVVFHPRRSRSVPEGAPARRPRPGPAAQRWESVLRYAVLAPSGHNAQPWLFELSPERIDLYCDRGRALPVVDPADREMLISCGAALFHLRVALAHFGFDYRVETGFEAGATDRLATVTISGRRRETREENALFHAMARRHTDRRPFRPRAVRESLVWSLRHCARREGAWLHVLRHEPDREVVADLIAEGDRIQLGDRRFRAELAEWVHPTSGIEGDGLTPQALGLPRWSESMWPLMRLSLRRLNLGFVQARRDRQLALQAPVLAVLGTSGDTRQDWFAAGQALARLLLRAAAGGVSASFLNQPIELPALRGRLRRLLGAHGHPQMLLRMGYGQPTAPSPRRPVNDVILRRSGDDRCDTRRN